MAKDKDLKTPNVPPLRFPGFTDEWKKITLGEIADVTKLAGYEFTKYVIYEDEGEIIALRGLNCKSGQLVLDDVKYIDHSDLSKLTRSKLYIGDILFTYVGTVGEVAIIDKNDKYYLAPNVSRIRLRPGNCEGFVMQQLSSKKFYNSIVFPLIATSSQPALSMENVRKFVISIPSIKEQNKIAQLLSIIDERIATQNKIIEDLKKLKSAIIESHFNGCKSNRKIGDMIIEISNRNKDNKPLPVLSVSNKSGFIAQSEQFSDRTIASEDTSNYKIVIVNDFAYNPARINVGSIARLINFDSGIVSPMYICFRCAGEISPEYLELFFQSGVFQLNMEKRLEGSVRQCLSLEGMKSIRLYVPPIIIQNTVAKRVAAIQNKLINEKILIQLHQRQRGYLLSSLFI